jgi:lipoprotein-anchoring transpeptidase ErfK/SrfK
MGKIRLLIILLCSLAAPLAANAHEVVPFENSPAGIIVIVTSERALYLTLGNGRALRYPVAVAKRGMQWHGTRYIDGKHVNPAWSPPPEVRRDHPHMRAVYEGGAPDNPMGVRALTLTGGEYAIHGTNRPNSVGRFASYGCFRMYNEDIMDLYERVGVGTPVVVTR